MKKTSSPLFALVAALGFAVSSSAEDGKPKAKPYPLETCVVSGEKFGGDMGKPYEFVKDGQQVKLCCKACLEDFEKDSAKYMKELEEKSKKK
jgi:hypothetical protein